MSVLKGAAARGIGLLLVLLCLGFVAWQVLTLDLRQISGESWLRMAGTVVIGGTLYGLAGFSLSLAWRQLLLWSGEPQAPARLCHGIYGRAQLGKYLPGNIFSIAGRHLLGRRNGFSDRALLWAAALEILGMTVISGLLFAIGASRLEIAQQVIELPLVLAVVALALVLPWIMKLVLPRLPLLRAYNLPHQSLRAYLRLYGIFFLYLPFFVAGSTLLWWLLGNATEGHPPSFLILLSLSSGAWLAGYITPGASGGIGVRDALLILAFKPFVGDAVVFATVAYRLATILGDLVFFLAALLFPLEPAKMPAQAPETTPSDDRVKHNGRSHRGNRPRRKGRQGLS